MEQKKETKFPKHLFFIRFICSIVFLFFGILHFIHPENFRNILIASEVPLVEINVLVVPIVEVIVGAFLLIGLWSRLAALIGLITSAVAIYSTVILMQLDPKHLPSGLREIPFYPPIFVPIILFLLFLYVLIRGVGAWGIDTHYKKKKLDS